MPGHIRRDGVARSGAVVAVFLAFSCTPEPTSIEPGVRSLHDEAAAHCVNVDTRISGAVEPLAGAGPASNVLTVSSTPVTVAGITGTLQTIVTGSSPTGRGTPSAAHITLAEHFVADAGSFTTEDHGVCTPAGNGQGSTACQLNDALNVLTGTGAFANAAGELTVHGTLDLGKGTLTADVHGRICGDGLGKNALPFTIQAGQPVSARIGPAGGAIRAAQNGVTFVLRIPPAALDAETTISVAPLVSIGPIPFSGGLVAGAQFEPNGLVLHRTAALEITLPTAVSTAKMLGFLIDDAGTRLEVEPAAVAGPTATVITIPVRHFTASGAANATLSDFTAQVTPLLNALPPTLPPGQVATLMDMWAAWLGRFGFDVCTQTNLCSQIFSTAINSLTLNQNQACVQAQSFLNAGEPFLARDELLSVGNIASRLFEVRTLADAAGITEFDQTLDVSCILSGLRRVIDVAELHAIDHTSSGILLLFVDVAGDAVFLGSTEVEDYARNGLKVTLDTLADRAAQSCASDPAAGENIINVVRSTFDDLILDGIDLGLASRLRDIRAGCRITIVPAIPTVTVGHTVSFTATTVGLTPAGVTWSIAGAALGSTIDATTGVFTAASTTGAVTVVATSQADASRFKRATVTILDEQCPASPASPASARRTRASAAFASAPSCVEVVVTPDNVSLIPGATQQFTATVTGAANTGVTWSATGGTITQAGLFTAGPVPGTYAVTVTSNEDQTVKGQASVVITASSSLVVTVLSAQAAAGNIKVTDPTTTLPVHLVVPANQGASGDFNVFASGNQIFLSGSASTSGGEQSGADVLLSFTTTKTTTFTVSVTPGWAPTVFGTSQAETVAAQVQTKNGDAVAGYSVLGGIVFDNRPSATITVAAGVTVQILFEAVAGSGATGAGIAATVTISP